MLVALICFVAVAAAQTPEDLTYRSLAIANANPKLNSKVALEDRNGISSAGAWVGHGKFAQEFDVAATAQEEKFQAALPVEEGARRFNSFGQLEEEQRGIRSRYSAANAAVKNFEEKERTSPTAAVSAINGFKAGEHEEFVRNSAALVGASQARRREATRLSRMSGQYDAPTVERSVALGNSIRGSRFSEGGEIRKQEYMRSLNADQTKALRRDSSTLYSMARHQEQAAADVNIDATGRANVRENTKQLNEIRAPLRGMGGLGWRTKARTEIQAIRLQKRLEEDQRNVYDPRFADKQASIERNIRRSTDALDRIKKIKYNEFGEVSRYNRRNQRLSVEGRVIRKPVVKDAAYQRRRTEVLRRRALGRTGRAAELSAYNTRRTELKRQRSIGRSGRATEAAAYAAGGGQKRARRY